MSAVPDLIVPQSLSQLRDIYHQARFLDGYEILKSYSPAESWSEPEGRILAARFLQNLGAARQSNRLIRNTYRAFPESLEARYYYALGVTERHGVFEGLRFVESIGPKEPSTVSGELISVHDLHLRFLRARLLAAFRDFDASEVWLQHALALAPADPWGCVEEAGIRQAQDRLDQSMQAIDRALRFRPNYRPAVGMKAHLLTQQGRKADAIEVLVNALSTMQSAHLAQQLAMLYIEDESFSEAAEALEKAQRFSPLAEKNWVQWHRARQADVLYRLGNYKDAIAAAKEVSGFYFETFAQRLESATEPYVSRRVVHEVEFVRQHHMTCAPATLSALSLFWKKPIDHIELAKAITYDGTPDHVERFWLEKEGWFVREFRVTWEIGKALIDRGVPFTLVTTAIRSAHLQAVIGYDDLIGTFVIRDPSQPSQTEARAVELLEQQSAHGPRGLIMLPHSERAKIDGIELPDTALYDLWYKLRRGLENHERSIAEEAVVALEALAPGHRLAWLSRRELAYYDDNLLRTHECVEALRKLFPKEPNLRLEELSLLDRLGRRTERIEKLREYALVPGSDPVFWHEYADTLRTDARERPRAMKYAHRLMLARPIDWLNLTVFAHLIWGEGNFEGGARVYRLAATVGEKIEAPWNAFFSAAALTGRAEMALQLLRDRYARLGNASVSPLKTLCSSLERMERTPEAHLLISDALSTRPDDSELLLLAAESFGRVGEYSRAKELLERARQHVNRVSWIHTAARLASWRGDHMGALELSRELLKTNPLNVFVIRETARLISIVEGRRQTLDWLGQQIERFPHFSPLRQVNLEWLRSVDPTLALRKVEDYLGLVPSDAWAWREKAAILLRLHDWPAALSAAKSAEEIDPRTPASPGIVGQTLLRMRQFKEARTAIERALRLSIDADWLIPQLIQTCSTFAERRSAVDFLREQLVQQVSVGGGFLAFKDVATGIIPAAELYDVLNALRLAQPAHWEIWAASVQQSIVIQKLDLAASLGREAVKRFSLTPRLWVDLADVFRARDELQEEKTALEKALAINPGWSLAALRLAAVHVRSGRYDSAEAVISRALQRDPIEPRLTTEHARLLWQLDRRPEALQKIERTISLAPSQGLAWSLLTSWSRETGEVDKVISLARKLAEERPGDPEPLWRLGHELSVLERVDEALGSLEKALSLDPTHISSHDYRAFLLAKKGRYDEALDACRPAALGADVPTSLRGRAAWVEWSRGNRAGAVTQLQALVTEAPDYSWGWQVLSEWLEQLGQLKEAQTAAEKYADLNPDLVFPIGYIGDLRRKNGEKKQAAEAFRRALRIDPSYVFAATGLLEISSECSEWGEAEQALSLIQKYGSAWQALSAEIVMCRGRKDKAKAVEILKRIALAPSHETNSLASAAYQFEKALWHRELTDALLEASTDPTANQEIGAIWVRTYRSWGQRPPLHKLMRTRCREVLKQSALAVRLENLGESKAWVPLLWLLMIHRRLIRADDRAWGAAAYALTRFGSRRIVCRWMNDWNARSGVQPWMLYNLCAALIELKRHGEAQQGLARALQLPADRSRPTFVAWAAFYAALRGDVSSAQGWLRTFDPPKDFITSQCIANQAKVLIKAWKDSDNHQRGKFKELRAQLTQAVQPMQAIRGADFAYVTDNLARRQLANLHRAPIWQFVYIIQALRPRRQLRLIKTVAAVVIFGTLAVGVVVGMASSASGGDSPAPVGGILLAVAAISAFARRGAGKR